MAVSNASARALRALIPPRRLHLAEWIERHLVLPSSTSALPGRVKLWSYQRDIAAAIGDPLIEKVSVIKCVRIGYTTLLTGAIGAFVANDPAPILCFRPRTIAGTTPHRKLNRFLLLLPCCPDC